MTLCIEEWQPDPFVTWLTHVHTHTAHQLLHLPTTESPTLHSYFSSLSSHTLTSSVLSLTPTMCIPLSHSSHPEPPPPSLCLDSNPPFFLRPSPPSSTSSSSSLTIILSFSFSYGHSSLFPTSIVVLSSTFSLYPQFYSVTHFLSFAHHFPLLFLRPDSDMAV